MSCSWWIRRTVVGWTSARTFFEICSATPISPGSRCFCKIGQVLPHLHPPAILRPRPQIGRNPVSTLYATRIVQVGQQARQTGRAGRVGRRRPAKRGIRREREQVSDARRNVYSPSRGADQLLRLCLCRPEHCQRIRVRSRRIDENNRKISPKNSLNIRQTSRCQPKLSKIQIQK